MERSHRGLIVAMAGLGVNLCLGVLYGWGVKSAALIDELGWTATQTQLPYMTASAFFAFSMVPAGRLQDRHGPQLAIVLAAVLTGIGFAASAATLSVVGLMLSFGVVFGVAMGLGYAAPTPAAIKWFGRHRRGIVSGVVVSGFGLAPLVVAPLTASLIARFGIAPTFNILGAGFFGAMLLLSRLVVNPPADYKPPEEPAALRRARVTTPDWDWRQMLRTRQFYALWAMFCFGTFSGLLIIGQIAKIGLEQAGITTPFVLVGFYAAANAAGRVVFGVVSDRLGRERTLFLLFVIQAVVYLIFGYLRTPATLIAGTLAVGLTFGGMLTLFPALSADYYGLKRLGLNYGLLFTAWGSGGIFGPLLGGLVRDATGTYVLSYLVSAALSAVGAWLSLRTPPVRQEFAEPEGALPVID